MGSLTLKIAYAEVCLNTFWREKSKIWRENPKFGWKNPNFGGKNPKFGGKHPNFGGKNQNFGGKIKFLEGNSKIWREKSNEIFDPKVIDLRLKASRVSMFFKLEHDRQLAIFSEPNTG